MNTLTEDTRLDTRNGSTKHGLKRSKRKDVSVSSADLKRRYEEVRGLSERLCETLETEDYVIQSMPEASPIKWHLAHTSWFFETFLLQPNISEYQSAHPQYNYLFNSYYNAVGPFHCRPKRGLLSRPTVTEVYSYRHYVDGLILELLDRADEPKLDTLGSLITLGLNHEQQHQELMLTDIKHVFSQNPLRPIYRERRTTGANPTPQPMSWFKFEEGIYSIGNQGSGFRYDNEEPFHRVFTNSFLLSSRLVTNKEYLGFMEDGGYQRPELWLSLGWNTVKEKGWQAPLYWEQQDGVWRMMTLSGMRDVSPEEPVCHVSFFEAEAFARWSGARLPSEEEWELASLDVPLEGNFVDNGLFHPAPLDSEPMGLGQMFGDVWEWTRSPYSPYPGYAPVAGALGEYNGKFMCNQFVLRGGSCATSKSHIRRTYRNFFPPDARWQFAGFRLAKEVK